MYSWNELTTKNIMTFFLYGEMSKPNNIADDQYIRNEQYYPVIKVNAFSFMQDGPGRFASGCLASVVDEFMSGGIVACDGVKRAYRLSEMMAELNDDKSDRFGISQSSYRDGRDDYQSRTYIYETEAFKVSNEAMFVVEANGTRYIQDFAIVPFDDNFDFRSFNPLSIVGNYLYSSKIDPFDIGRTLLLHFTPDSKNAIPRVSYTQADFEREKSYQATVYMPVDGALDLYSEMSPVMDDLWNSGITVFTDTEDRVIYFGSRSNDVLSENALFIPLARPLSFDSPLRDLRDNGVVLVGGAGSDTLTGGLGDDLLDGGWDDDRFLVDTSTTFGRDVVVDPAGDGADQLLLDGEVIGKVYAVEKNGNLFRFLDEQGNPAEGKEDWVLMRNGTDMTVQLTAEDGSFRIIVLQQFDKTANHYGVDLVQEPHALPDVMMINPHTVGDGTLGGDDFLSPRRMEQMTYGDGSYLDASLSYSASAYWQPGIDSFLAEHPDNIAIYWKPFLFEGSLQADVLNGHDWQRPGAPSSDLLEGEYYWLDDGQDGVFFADVLWGLDGDDLLTGDGSVTDKEKGDEDLLIGGRGDDRLYGGGGADTLFASEMPVLPSLDAVFLLPIPGLLPSVGFGDLEHLRTAEGQDAFRKAIYQGQVTLEDQNEKNLLDGGAGDDNLAGASYRDVLIGGKGEDYLLGGAGQDVIAGGDDTDFIYGDSCCYTGMPGEFLTFAADYIAPDLAPANLEDNDRYYYWQQTPADNRFDKDLDYNDIIDGGDGQDFIMGEIGSDQIYGGEGDDFIDGDRVNTFEGVFILTDEDRVFQKLSLVYHGNDYLDGGIGNDYLRGNGGNDNLDGGVGNDAVYGDDPWLELKEGGNDVLHGGNGSDRLLGNGGNDRLYGDAGDDYLWGDANRVDGSGGTGEGAGDDFLAGGEGADGLFGNDGNDRLEGGAGDDVLEGNSGKDSLSGGKGHDDLRGGAGDDTYVFDGGDGDNSCHMYGDVIHDNEGALTIRVNGNQSPGNSLFLQWFSGADAVLYYSSNTGDSIYLPADTLACLSAVVTTAGRFSLVNLTNARGTAGNDTLTGMVWDDAIDLAAGDDVMSGKAGNDSLHGGLGVDTLWGNEGVDSLYGDTGDDYLYGDMDNDCLYGGDGSDQLTGGDGNDVMAGDMGADILLGSAGNDTLCGGSGYDALQGGAGDDVYTFSPGDGALNAAGTYGDTISDGSGALTLHFNGIASLTALQLHTLSNDTAIVHYGIAAADSVYLDLGSWRNFSAIVLNGEAFTVDDLLTASASDASDSLRGTAGDNCFSGLGGNDILDGRFGKDALFGNEGDDILYGDTGNDVLWGGSGADRLYAGYDNDVIHAGDSNDVLMGDHGNDVLFGDENDDQLSGGAGDDWLIAGSGDDVLSGGAGNDALGGESGNDRLDGGTQDDTYYFTTGWGQDRIVDFDAAGRDIVYLFGDASRDDTAFRIAENRNNLVVTLPDGSTLTIEDYLVRAGTVDAFYFMGEDGTVLVALDTPEAILAAAMTGAAGNDTLFGTTGNDVISGLAGNDYLAGDDGNDTLAGGDGDDVIDGGAGNDVLRYVAGHDSFTVKGADVIELSVVAAAMQCRRVFSGCDANGNDQYNDLLLTMVNDNNNTLLLKNYCTEGADTLLYFSDVLVTHAAMLSQLATPGAGDDVLIGDAAANTLAGGKGNDVLLGAEGIDTYVFQPGDGQDVLVDPSAGTDLVQVMGVTQNDLKLTHVTGADGKQDLVVELLNAGVPAGDRITVQNYFRDSDAGMDLQCLPDKGKVITLTWAEVVDIARNDYLAGSSDRRIIDTLDGKGGNDTLVGFEGGDTLTGGRGNDVLVGGTDGANGSYFHSSTTPNRDTYLYTKGDGNDRILNASVQAGGLAAGELHISGYSANEAVYQREGNDLCIRLGQERITIERWFLSEGPYAHTRDPLTGVTQSFMFENGFLSHQLDAIYFGRARIGYDTVNTGFSLTEGNDLVGQGYGWTFEDRRADVYHGMGGDDLLLTGLLADTLYGDTGNDTLDGGEHNDILVGGIGNDTYINDGVARGDNDVINNTDALAADVDTLSITGAMADYRALWFTRGGDGNDLVIDALGYGGSLAVLDWFGSNAQAKLDTVSVTQADGTSVSLTSAGVDALVQAMAGFSAVHGMPTSLTQEVKDLHDTSLEWGLLVA